MARISEDLKKIRKEMRLSKQDVFEKCRIPLETIESIEDGSIFSGQTRNITYLRSYFRSYAKAIGIRNEDIVTALDEHQADLYDGLLSNLYLTSKATPDVKKEDTPQSPSEKEKESKKSKKITPESQDKTIEDVEWEDSSIKKTRATSTSGYASSESRETTSPAIKSPPPPDLKQVDWAGKVKKAIYKPQKNRLLWVSLATVLALGLAIAFVYWYWLYQEENDITTAVPAPDVAEEVYTEPDPEHIPDDPEEATTVTEPEVVLTEEPSPTEEAIAEEEEEPEPVVSIEMKTFTSLSDTDTLHVYIYALHGNMEPVRVESDIFAQGENTVSLRPYWIEHREAMEFEFTDDIIIQGALSRMVLVVNGHVIQDFSDLYLDGPRIQLSRSFIEENEYLQTPSDSPFETIPAPAAIVDRPRFSN
ncbi:helix-turn-helix domain-containing protein [Balneolaceae bacterium ANBcel3]|nr:helix-turn-helix domain-containing protein [Balneolaceae bacterium ANBcel3]